MIGIDTNVLLRVLLDDDPGQYARAMGLIKGARQEGPILINPIVLAEAVWTLTRKLRTSRAEIVSKVEQILDTDGIEVAFPDAAGRALKEYRAGPADFADYLLAEINLDLGCRTTFTFDEDAAESASYSSVP
ncbi:MAG TPA: type II toxin-antitoxin system VapC family toxin [Beijerinckiaceae bacterium]|jgi:predicted nucleic-acid-binding protein|nr:type II toxin-antitoxin system VapC family toxin [Beijerinckiaceae bacterium]